MGGPSVRKVGVCVVDGVTSHLTLRRNTPHKRNLDKLTTSLSWRLQRRYYWWLPQHRDLLRYRPCHGITEVCWFDWKLRCWPRPVQGCNASNHPCRPNKTRRGEVVVAVVTRWEDGWLVSGPPCGSASRTRQISMSNKRKSHGPKPLRTDSHPNGRLHLSFKDRQRASLAKKLYDLTSRLVERAVANGCIICVENPQFSLFWATTFWISVAHLVSYAVFHSCQYGSARQKKTMIAFSHREF